MSDSRWRRPVLYTLLILIFQKVKHHFRGRPALFEGDVQTLGRQEFYSDVLKYALLDRHKVHVLKLVLT